MGGGCDICLDDGDVDNVGDDDDGGGGGVDVDDDVVIYVWVIWMYGQLFWQPLLVTGDRKHTKLRRASSQIVVRADEDWGLKERKRRNNKWKQQKEKVLGKSKMVVQGTKGINQHQSASSSMNQHQGCSFSDLEWFGMIQKSLRNYLEWKPINGGIRLHVPPRMSQWLYPGCDYLLRIEDWGLRTASHLLGPHSSFLSPQSLKTLKPKNPNKLKKSSPAPGSLATTCASLAVPGCTWCLVWSVLVRFRSPWNGFERCNL